MKMNSNNIEWKTSINNDEAAHICSVIKFEVQDHPLSVSAMNNVDRIPRRILGSQPSTGHTSPVTSPSVLLQPLNYVLEGFDPLTQFAKEEIDPLRQMAADMTLSDGINLDGTVSKKGKQRKVSFNVEPWSNRRNTILARFTTSEKLSIVTSFLSDGEKVVMKTQSMPVDKVTSRLEQLDYFEEGSQRRFNLSQTEYVNRIEQLNRELVKAWNSEQRVKALKIAIQCAKVLADTDVLIFYPSKFVLITDILDIFGQLVYERLRTKADYCKPGSKIPTALPEDFTPDMVPESAKETCRNWFYKIASIRELVPRLYVEMAILKSYSFLTSSEYSAALLRLTRMIRGIGNPLVAIYARCYLCRVGITITAPGTDTHYLVENYYDFLETYNQLHGTYVQEELKIQKMGISSYLTLYTPALDFILQLVAYGATDNLLAHLIERCRQYQHNSLLINTIMAAFKPSYIAQRTMEFLELIENCSQDDFPHYFLLRTLGLCACLSSPPFEQRRQIVNSVWNMLGKLTNPEHYISCVEVWVQFAVQHFSSREVNIILGDIVAHLSPKRAYEEHYTALKEIVAKIISHIQDLESLLTMDNFLPLVDLFQQETVRVEVCKRILTASAVIQQTNDPVITNSLMFLCGVLHDSINALTVDDEQRQISELLCGVVKKVNYGRDFEQQLNFYVEARASFSNLDPVLAQLVQCVNTLAVNTHCIMKGQHTSKTAAFVRACAAYCFITVPSITSVFTRLELYLLSGRVSLFNNCLSQADACFKAALAEIPELSHTCEKQKLVEPFLLSYAKDFLSTLLIVPDNPDRGVLSLTRMFINTLQKFEWESHHLSLASLYINVLSMLSTMAQESYPYHISKVESNNTLYGSDPKFISEVDKMCSVILRELLSQLKELGPGRQQSSLALELVVILVTNADLNNNNIAALALKLWQLSVKHGHVDLKYAIRTRDYLQARSSNIPTLQQLVNKLNISQ